MSENKVGSYEILAKVTKRDCTSLVSIICYVDDRVVVVLKEDVAKFDYSNAKVGVNGKLYMRERIGRPIPVDRLSGVSFEGLSKSESVRILDRLRVGRTFGY